MNNLNILNEGVTLLIALILPVFIEISIDKATFDMAGWFLVGAVGFVVLVNMAVILVVKFKEFFDKIRQKCCKKKGE